MSDYDTIYNMLVRAGINFSIGQNLASEYYIIIPPFELYETDVEINFNYDMSLREIRAS